MGKIELDTRERILQAAEKEFLEKGYTRAMLRDISKKAGVTTGALYGYFKSKEDLFGALVGQEYQWMLDRYDMILEEFHSLPPEKQVADMHDYSARGMRQMSEYMYDHRDAFKLILCKSEGTHYHHLVEEMAARNVQATKDFSQTNQNVGVTFPPVNPTLEKMLTYSMFSNFFEMIRQDLPREQVDEYISQLLDFFTGGWEKLWGC